MGGFFGREGNMCLQQDGRKPCFSKEEGGRGRFRKEKYEAFGCDVVSGACLKEEDGEDKIVAKRRYC